MNRLASDRVDREFATETVDSGSIFDQDKSIKFGNYSSDLLEFSTKKQQVKASTVCSRQVKR